MLSMAGLLCSSKQEEAPSSPQEAWWSSSGQHSLQQAAQHQRRLQGAGKSPMDSQGNSSSEAWDNQGVPSPNPEYQYFDPSMSPPLHPSKRNAPNPPPISNQATKGSALRFTPQRLNSSRSLVPLEPFSHLPQIMLRFILWSSFYSDFAHASSNMRVLHSLR